MSDEKGIIVGDTRIYGNVNMAAENRDEAVKIALELIKASCAGAGSGPLAMTLESLSAHADKIQKALKKE